MIKDIYSFRYLTYNTTATYINGHLLHKFNNESIDYNLCVIRIYTCSQIGQNVDLLQQVKKQHGLMAFVDSKCQYMVKQMFTTMTGFIDLSWFYAHLRVFWDELNITEQSKCKDFPEILELIFTQIKKIC